MSSDARWVDSMPELYDQCLGPVLFAPFAAHVADLIAARAGVAPRLLEVAAGTGIGTAALVAALPSARITATDLNPAMIAWAAARVEGPDWLVADAQHLEFAADTFDYVVCQFGAMFFPDKPAAFAEAARVLAPRGTAVYTIWDAVEYSTFTAALVASLAVVLPDDPPSFIVRVPHGYADPDRIRADLRAGGLEPTSIERVVLTGHAASARELARGFCLGTPIRFELAERGQLDVLMAAIGDEMTARLGDGPIDGDLTALVVTAQASG